MGRRYCSKCCKPEKVCLCKYFSVQANRFPVLVLQHNDERKKPLSTVPLIEAGLEQVRVMCGINFNEQSCLDYLVKVGSSHPLLLYPTLSPNSNDNVTLDLDEDVSLQKEALVAFDSLIVLDGTWRNTRELFFSNSWLSSLVTLSLKNVGKSRYRIRKSTQEESLSTIEAVSRIMSCCEPEFSEERFLLPFEKMIDQQIDFMGEKVFQKNYS